MFQNPMEWIIIWKQLSEENPHEFLPARMKIYTTLGSIKFSKWEPLISSLQALKFLQMFWLMLWMRLYQGWLRLHESRFCF